MKYILLILFALLFKSLSAQTDSSFYLQHFDNKSMAVFESQSYISTVDSNGNSIDLNLTNDRIYINGDTAKALKFAMKQIGELLTQICELKKNDKPAKKLK